jgi:hypothetical protein
MVRFFLIAGLLGGCADLHEGMQAGECLDGLDNDGNGIVDCADLGCMASPDCATEDQDTPLAGVGSDAGDSWADDTGAPAATSGSDEDAAQDSDDEWLITEDVWDDSCNRNTVELTLPSGETRVLDGWVWFRGDFGPEIIGIERGGRDTCQQVGNFGEYEGYNNRIVMYGIPDSETVVPVIPEVGGLPPEGVWAEADVATVGHSTEASGGAMSFTVMQMVPTGGLLQVEGFGPAYDDGTVGAVGDFTACYCPSGEDPDAGPQ